MAQFSTGVPNFGLTFVGHHVLVEKIRDAAVLVKDQELVNVEEGEVGVIGSVIGDTLVERIQLPQIV